jgi:hypothetical protein
LRCRGSTQGCGFHEHRSAGVKRPPRSAAGAIGQG